MSKAGTQISNLSGDAAYKSFRPSPLPPELNIDDEIYKETKSNLKKYYPYEYYRYVDLDIKKEAEDYAENYHCAYENMKQYYKTWSKRFKKERNRLARKITRLKKPFYS